MQDLEPIGFERDVYLDYDLAKQQAWSFAHDPDVFYHCAAGANRAAETIVPDGEELLTTAVDRMGLEYWDEDGEEWTPFHWMELFHIQGGHIYLFRLRGVRMNRWHELLEHLRTFNEENREIFVTPRMGHSGWY